MIDPRVKAAAELEIRNRNRRVELASKYDWSKNARPKQLAPKGDWSVWMILAGRGFGKTRSGAEWVRSLVENATEPLRIALIGDTPGDVRKVMIQGPSGILTISPPWFMPIYLPSNRELIWPNGCIATTFSYNNPKPIRGPEHHYAWCDELVNADKEEVWDNLEFGMRLGKCPQTLITTTPKPKPLIKRLAGDEDTVITGGSTYENKDNLSAKFIKRIEKKYEGTRLGRQELYAELLTDVEGALWTYALIEEHRLRKIDKRELRRIVVAVDPAASSHEKSDETGIVVVGLGKDGLGYVLDDGTIRGTPNERACEVKRLWKKWQADYIVAEVNNGGDMVAVMLKTVDKKNKMTIKTVHASRGKYTRAEPVAALYEQGRVIHVGPKLGMLEDELCSWEPKNSDSPNRLDAMVWGVTELMLEESKYDIFALTGK